MQCLHVDCVCTAIVHCCPLHCFVGYALYVIPYLTSDKCTQVDWSLWTVWGLNWLCAFSGALWCNLAAALWEQRSGARSLWNLLTGGSEHGGVRSLVEESAVSSAWLVPGTRSQLKEVSYSTCVAATLFCYTCVCIITDASRVFCVETEKIRVCVCRYLFIIYGLVWAPIYFSFPLVNEWTSFGFGN